MATLNLGRTKPVFRGAYAGGTAYGVDDIVTAGNETFICILASTGNATSNATYWTKLAAKGTDGTDVGATITTEGDILYRDGSGLQRLAKGTGEQTLKMNSGATAPEWVTVTPPTSDFVLLSTVTASNQAAVSFDGFYSATYRDYYYTVSNCVPETDSKDLWFRIRESDADYTGAEYRGHISGSEKYSGGVAYGSQGYAWWDDTKGACGGHSGGLDDAVLGGGHSGNYTFFNPLSTTHKKWVLGNHCYYNGDSNNVIGGIHRSVINRAPASSGVTFYMESGNIVEGVFKLYGLK